MTKNLKDYGKCRKCSEDGDEVATNKILHKYGIKREAYHGGQLNGEFIRRLMAESEDIIHGIFILLKGCSRGYVTDKNVEQVCRTHAKLLRQLNGFFS